MSTYLYDIITSCCFFPHIPTFGFSRGVYIFGVLGFLVNNVRAAVNNVVWDKSIGQVLKMQGVHWESAVLRGV